MFNLTAPPKPMDESLVIRPADSNEVVLAKTTLQMWYYFCHGTAEDIIHCLPDAVQCADEVLKARGI